MPTVFQEERSAPALQRGSAAFALPVETRAAARQAFLITAGALVWLGNLFFPIAPAVALDPSWQWVLNHAATTDYVFGHDVVYTYGPWGWLTTQYYHPPTFLSRLAWEYAFKALCAALVVLASTGLSRPRRVTWLGASLVLPPLFQDTFPMLVIGGTAVWIARARPGAGATLLVGALSGFLALQKFSYLLAAASVLAPVAVQLMLQRRWPTLGALATSVFGVFVSGWLAAGQPLGALPNFLQRAAWVSVDYTDAMGFEESAEVFGCGVGVASLFLLLIWDRPRWRSLPLTLALTCMGFLSWKHGFVRADGHTMGFFFLMAFAAIAAPWLNPSATWRRTFLSALLGVLSLAGAAIANPELPAIVARSVREYLPAKAHAALNVSQLYV
ncbi:MAG TPA: hypothetical protein VEQ65_04700, partial [Opitutus sp.]|nr:hypothetical protein [Opitutus sp.]